MKVLVLAPDVPYPVIHGGRKRIAGLMRCLTRFASVRVLAAGDPGAESAALSSDRLRDMGVALDVFRPTGPLPGDDETDVPGALAHFRCPALAAALPDIAADFDADVVLFLELVMAQYASLVSAPRVLDRQKVESLYHEAMATGEAAAAHHREAERFRRYDAAVAPQFAATLTVGPLDRDILSPLYGDRLVHVVSNGVDDEIRRPPDRSAEIRHVLLYGSLDYGPNVDANDRYFREIWPALSRAMPQIRTTVVGSGTPPPSLPRDDARVIVHGYVPEIVPILTGPGVLLVPLRVGGGVRNKILEALAAGMPVVSTAVGVESLGLEPGKHYLPAESASDFVEAVCALVRDPGRGEALGRAGAAYVDRYYRWDAIGRGLEAVLAAVARPRIPAVRAAGTPSPRALLVGVRPLPDEPSAQGLSFPGHRTAQFGSALERAGCETHTILLDEDPASPALRADGTVHVLAPESFRSGAALQQWHDRIAPDVVVAAGGYHAARVVSQLATAKPRYVDLAGDLAAEGQARAAAGGDGVLDDYLSVLSAAVSVADRFAVVGPSQRLALLGQLGLGGRLVGSTLGQEPVDVVPLGAAGPSVVPPLPGGGLRVLWTGGYNTWMDGESLFSGLEDAMRRREDITFVSTGGPIPGHDDESHRAFWARVRLSALSGRFFDRGRVSREASRAELAAGHVVLAISRSCLEAELGSRQRVVEAMAHGRPVIMTRLGDLASAVADSGAGLVVPPRAPQAIADALVSLAQDRARLGEYAHRARALWESRFTYQATAAPLTEWVRRPTRWPRSARGDTGFSRLATERQRLQSELDLIRGSRTFRALRAFDRLLGRGRASR